MQELNFVTGNTGKIAILEAELIERSLRNDFQVIKHDIDLVEIQSDSIADISRYKAQQAWELLKKPVIVNDGGLNIPGLNGFPGAYTKYMITTLGAEAFFKLVHDLKDRRAIFTNVTTYVDANGHYHQFHDDSGDNIVFSDRVVHIENPRQFSEMWKMLKPVGYGFDKTLAELTEDEMTTFYARRAEGSGENGFRQLVDHLIQGQKAEAA